MQGVISFGTSVKVLNGRDHDAIKASRWVIMLHKQINGIDILIAMLWDYVLCSKKQDYETICDIATKKEIGSYDSTNLPHIY